MEENRRTKAQEDSALRLAERERAAIAHIRVVHGATASELHEVRSTGTIVGRETGDIRCGDERISRQHVRIERTASGWQLADLGSRNGGFVDGRVFRTGDCTALGDGTVIRLGDTLLSFRTSPPLRDPCSTAPAFPGVSPIAAAVRRRIDSLAPDDGHVLILGETGTGKERVAHAIAMHRTGHPFLAQNCGELSRELARAELFGHVKGAFTGATHNKPGLVDSARDGVVFLDEIGELTLEVQRELLRFLEDGSYRAVGEPAVTKTSRARVIAATNVDLDQAVAAGAFRRDLVARLRASNAPLQLPPLRERREDIPQWIRLFLREAGRPDDGELWTVGALECLLVYPWLENLRELRGVVRTLVVEGVKPPWRAEDLPPGIRQHRNVLRTRTDPPPEELAPPRPEPTQAEIENALRQTRGTMIVAAKLLGLQRRKLYRLCEVFGIEIDSYRDGPQSEDE